MKMAFRFRTREPIQVQQSTTKQTNNEDNISPKLTNTQLNKSTRLYPPWLKDNTVLKQLPGIYQGVLGQVQLQPDIQEIEKRLNYIRQDKPTEYMNKFTDTQRVHQLLLASQLSNETLATIWAYVNKTFPGKLTNREVCLALALVANFQKLEKDHPRLDPNSKNSITDKDPFNLVRTEKKPPVPILYPNHVTRGAKNNSIVNFTESSSYQSKSSNSDLDTDKGILVDIFTDDDKEFTIPDSTETKCIEIDEGDKISPHLDTKIRNALSKMSLIDFDCDIFELEFNRTTETWLRFLTTMKRVFKRSFDILNVDYSRQSAIEALNSPRGQDFGKNLCICYPLAHNIKHKINYLSNIKLSSYEQSNNTLGSISGLFDKNYTSIIDDLMTSINEYWAVLINLLHESGLTDFIELIMDGLNNDKNNEDCTILIEDLVSEFSGRPDMCCICHTRFYLNYEDLSSRDLSSSIEDLVAYEDLISNDNQHYYHPKCASFWLNQVDTVGLPFSSNCTEVREILSPALVD